MTTPEGQRFFLYKSYCFFYKVEKWRWRRFTLQGLVVSYVVFFTAIISTDTRISQVYQVFALLFAVWLSALVWTRCLRRLNIDAVRELPPYATVGQALVYDVTFVNRTTKQQTGLSFYENTPDRLPSMEELLSLKEPGEDKRNIWDRKILYYRWLWIISKKRILEGRWHAVPPIPAEASLKVRVQVVPQNRGYLYFNSLEIARPDPFGLCRALFPISARQTLVVMPKRYPLPTILLSGARRHHARGVSLASSIGNHDEFISLRDYRPGDSMRQIHWRSSAKRNELVIKECQDEYYARHALILDTFSNVAYSDIFEEAVSIAASLVCALQNREALLDLIFVGTQAHCFSSGRGTTCHDHLLEILAAVGTCQDKPFEAITSFVFERVQLLSDCICVLLAWDESRARFVRDLKRMGVPVSVIVIVAEDASAPIDPGPMQGEPGHFFVLKAGHIEEGLAGI